MRPGHATNRITSGSASGSGSLMPVTNLSVNGRFVAGEREWMKPSNAGQYGYRSGFEERYGILDNAYVKWNNIADQPLTLSAGRQDIALGDPDDWWLVLDGTPGDGSWTYFLDSIRTSYELKNVQTKIDVIYIYQNARPDAWIPHRRIQRQYVTARQNTVLFDRTKRAGCDFVPFQ